MSSVTDSILNSVILLSVVLILGLIVTAATLDNMRVGSDIEFTALLEEQTDAAAQAFLESTVNGESISNLLGRAMVELRTDLLVNNETIDIVEVSEERLDTIYGENNYYFSLSPVIKGVNLMFVFDFSPSTQSEISAISNNLENIQEQIQEFIRETGTGDEIVSIQVFMLPGAPGRCDIIRDLTLGNTNCFELSPDELYPEDWEKPSFGYASFETWNSQQTYATTLTFAQSDWAAGTAYAAQYFDNDPFLKNQASINFIFPMSDELAGSSKSDACFRRGNVAEFIVCQMCDNACPGSAADRSESLVNQAITNIQAAQTQSRVFPIFSVACDFEYAAGYNQFSFSDEPAFSQYRDAGGFGAEEYPEVTWCSQDACTACERQGDSFCFQNQCWPSLQEHMSLLAQATGGNTINVNDVDTIPTQLLTSFNATINEFDLSVGVLDTNRERFIHEKIVQLPNGFLSKLSLWVYR